VKLFEYEAKKIFAQYNIPIPQGRLVSSSEQVKDVVADLCPPFVIKAQVLVAGRGKAGGIKFAKDSDEAEMLTAHLLQTKIKGLTVNSVLIEEKKEVHRELYFGITTDRTNQCFVAITSSIGGVNIEEVAEKEPEKILKLSINPDLGFRNYHARELVRRLGYTGASLNRLAKVFTNLSMIAKNYDAELVEMNPLVETGVGEFVAVDTRLIMDDNALFRHPEFEQKLFSEERTELTPEEILAKRSGLAYVKLDGDIGIMGNGAGLVMATLDTVQFYHGSPANFLDVGGGASEDQIASALDILLRDQRTSVVLINILGGITRCDDVARGILEAKQRTDFTKPIVIRLVGTNEVEGQRVLTVAGIHVLDSMEEAAKKAVEISAGR
jgi:succinyl-CoA synthetase beta subunit